MEAFVVRLGVADGVEVLEELADEDGVELRPGSLSQALDGDRMG